MGHFKEAVAIVTGGASGIGHALCSELADRGARAIILADIDEQKAHLAAADISSSATTAQAFQVDVTQPETVRRLIEETASTFGRLDFMINNAGIAVRGEFQDMGLEQWRRIVDINVWGVIHGCMWAYRVMVGQGFGHIVNISSAGGLAPMPLASAYATTKHALVGLSTSLRAEGAGLGVKVSVACPGFIRTGIYDNTANTADSRNSGPILDQSTLKMIEPRECAQIILNGVERNRTIIPVTRFVRLLWLLNRINPQRTPNLFLRRIRKWRAAAAARKVP